MVRVTVVRGGLVAGRLQCSLSVQQGVTDLKGGNCNVFCGKVGVTHRVGPLPGLAGPNTDDWKPAVNLQYTEFTL